jgi:hypothetical protein
MVSVLAPCMYHYGVRMSLSLCIGALSHWQVNLHRASWVRGLVLKHKDLYWFSGCPISSLGSSSCSSAQELTTGACQLKRMSEIVVFPRRERVTGLSSPYISWRAGYHERGGVPQPQWSGLLERLVGFEWSGGGGGGGVRAPCPISSMVM